MSVIITGMEIPYRCDECQLVIGYECPLLGIDVDEDEGSTDLRCPLKSVEELLEKFSMVNGCGDFIATSDVVKIIKEYCEE